MIDILEGVVFIILVLYIILGAFGGIAYLFEEEKEKK